MKIHTSLIAILTLLTLLEAIQSNNLLINPDFSNDVVNFNSTKLFNSSHNIDGWTCGLLSQLVQCNRLYGSSNCSGNFLDMNPLNTYQKVTQLVVLQKKKFLNLTFQFCVPRINDNRTKTLEVYFNSIEIYSITTSQADWLCLNKILIVRQVFGRKGGNNLTINMNSSRSPPPLSNDSYGFLMINTSLSISNNDKNMQELNVNLQNFMQYTLDNQIVRYLFRYSEGRTIFVNFAMLFTSFDRFQLYVYHNRNYSQNSLAFIKNINIIKQLQADFQKETVHTLKEDIEQIIDYIKNYFGFKQQYIEQVQKIIIQERIEGFKDGFMENQIDFIIYKMPFTLLTFLCLKILFKMLFNYPISILIRKYEFYGTLIIMILQGNIEELLFFLSFEAQIPLSFNFSHKIMNFFMIMNMFLILIASISIFMFAMGFMKKKAKYFLSNNKSSLQGIISSTIDRGIICAIFGFTHRLLINYPNIQLFALFSIEIAWIVSRWILMKRKGYESNALVCVWILLGLFRGVFIVTFYIYENFQQKRVQINNFHGYFIIVYLVTMIIQFLLEIKEFIKQAIKDFKKIFKKCFKNKVQDQSTKIEQKKQLNNRTVQQKKEEKNYILVTYMHKGIQKVKKYFIRNKQKPNKIKKQNKTIIQKKQKNVIFQQFHMNDVQKLAQAPNGQRKQHKNYSNMKKDAYHPKIRFKGNRKFDEKGLFVVEKNKNSI